jgi:hypothetical protein
MIDETIDPSVEGGVERAEPENQAGVSTPQYFGSTIVLLQ